MSLSALDIIMMINYLLLVINSFYSNTEYYVVYRIEEVCKQRSNKFMKRPTPFYQ